MSQRSAAWNLVVEGVPLALGGVVFLILLTARQARLAPIELFVSISSVYVVGLLLLVGAKFSLFRTGTYISFGSRSMTARARLAYRAAYALILVATLGAVGFVVAWH